MSGIPSSNPVAHGGGTHSSTPPARSENQSSSRTIDDRKLESRSRVLDLARDSWQILAVVGAFIISMLIVPVMLNVPVGDDWVYTRSVEILLQEGRVEILDLSVVTLIFQVFWGALFSLFFGISFGSMRLSSTILFLLSGVAMYGICLEMGVRKARAALGAAIYLFNPLSYVLAFTFMTDPQFASLMVIATYFYVRGLQLERPSHRAIIIGSAFAAMAFLVRQQGLLIPLAVGLYLFTARRWRFDRAGIITALRVAGIPILIMAGYYLWLIFSHGTPEQQGAFVDTIRSTGWESTRLLTFRMTYMELAYMGFFAIPVTAATFWHFLSGARDAIDRKLAWLHFAVLFMIMIAGGMIAFASANRLWPFISQYLGLHGLGPQDLIGGRDQLIGNDVRRVFTYLIFASTALLVMTVFRRFRLGASPERATASLVASLTIWQIVGIMPPSFHFASWIVSVDRYLLPLLPFAIAFALWSVKDIKLSLPVAWIVTGFLAFYSIAGTRDFLIFQDATWDMGEEAIGLGVTYTQLDAGAGWDGYYLYDQGLESGIATQSPGGSPWWTDLFAKATNSSYIVTSGVPHGWGEETIMLRQEYSSWLHDSPQYIYLLRRPGIPGPP